MAMNPEQIQQLFKMMGIGGGVAQAGMGAANLFGVGSKNPATGANNILSQIPAEMRPYFDKYMQSGSGALDTLNKEYSQGVNDPGGVYNKLGAGYHESPGYKFKLQQQLNAGTNAAAAGGMLGSNAHQQGNQQLANDIADQDFEKYMEHVSGLYNTGLKGYGDLNTQGYDASKDYATSLGNNMQQQAAYKYAGQAGQNQQDQSSMANIFSGIASALPYLFL